MNNYQNNRCCNKFEPRKDERDYSEEKQQENERVGQDEVRENENRHDDRQDDYREEKLKNKSSLQVEVCGKKHKIESNEVEARKINLIIKEEQNCDFVFCGDEVEYKVKIFNDSHVTVRNVEFNDTFSECGRYKKDSFKVNGRKEHPHVNDEHIKFNIDEIKPHQEIVICFEIYFK